MNIGFNQILKNITDVNANGINNIENIVVDGTTAWTKDSGGPQWRERWTGNISCSIADSGSYSNTVSLQYSNYGITSLSNPIRVTGDIYAFSNIGSHEAMFAFNPGDVKQKSDPYRADSFLLWLPLGDSGFGEPYARVECAVWKNGANIELFVQNSFEEHRNEFRPINNGPASITIIKIEEYV